MPAQDECGGGEAEDECDGGLECGGDGGWVGECEGVGIWKFGGTVTVGVFLVLPLLSLLLFLLLLLGLRLSKRSSKKPIARGGIMVLEGFAFGVTVDSVVAVDDTGGRWCGVKSEKACPWLRVHASIVRMASATLRLTACIIHFYTLEMLFDWTKYRWTVSSCR